MHAAHYSYHTLVIVLKYGETHILSNVKCLVVLQKRAIRLLYGAGRPDHTIDSSFLQVAHIKIKTDLVKFKTAMFMYRAYYCRLPSDIQRHFVKKIFR